MARASQLSLPPKRFHTPLASWNWPQRWLSTASPIAFTPTSCSALTVLRSASTPPYLELRLYRSRGTAKACVSRE